jgi:hypothetical protein
MSGGAIGHIGQLCSSSLHSEFPLKTPLFTPPNALARPVQKYPRRPSGYGRGVEIMDIATHTNGRQPTHAATSDQRRIRPAHWMTRAASIACAALVAICFLLSSADVFADSAPHAAVSERLQWMLATHDVRQAIHAPEKTPRASDCAHDESERAR